MTSDRPDIAIAPSPAPRTARYDRSALAIAAALVPLAELYFAKTPLAVGFWSLTTRGAALIALPTDRRWCSPIADADHRRSGVGSQRAVRPKLGRERWPAMSHLLLFPTHKEG